MEFKVRKESETLMEKVFHSRERRGVVRAYQIPSMLRSLNPSLCYDDEELKRQIGERDQEGLGLDMDSFNSIALHFLLQQSRRDSDCFSHKSEIGLHDFSLP